jgi:dTDP-4-dehydrorhamnose 3,5-epimerase
MGGKLVVSSFIRPRCQGFSGWYNVPAVPLKPFCSASPGGASAGRPGSQMRITVQPTAIPDVKILLPGRFSDARGFLSEVYKRSDLAAEGILFDVLQENHVMSQHAGTVRGLHFQIAPSAQAKLVRVVRGRAFDVAVDLRGSSPSFGRHVGIELSAENRLQMLIPAGFAHGFCTLEPATELVYKTSHDYAREFERGLLWNDPQLGIEWPVDESRAHLSDADRTHPRLRDLPKYFD